MAWHHQGINFVITQTPKINPMTNFSILQFNQNLAFDGNLAKPVWRPFGILIRQTYRVYTCLFFSLAGRSRQLPSYRSSRWPSVWSRRNLWQHLLQQGELDPVFVAVLCSCGHDYSVTRSGEISPLFYSSAKKLSFLLFGKILGNFSSSGYTKQLKCRISIDVPSMTLGFSVQWS